MGLIRASEKITTLPQKEMMRYIEIFLESVKNIVNGNLTANENMLFPFVEVDFTSANTNFVIEHGIGRSPRGYLVISSDSALSVYDGTRPSDSTFIYLRSSAVGKARIVFL